MHRHPYFQLWLHDDDELSTLLGEPIVERIVLQEWPLSCVQRLRLASGSTYIYKVQSAPTVEPSFYAEARSPLLVSAKILNIPGEPAALVLEDVEVSPRALSAESESARLATVEMILEQIAEIAGELPAVADIRSEEGWLAFANNMLSELAALIGTGRFRVVDHEIFRRIAVCIESPSVLEVIRSPSGFVHHDLKVENLLIVPRGLRVIDWQRPIWGPVALDEASLLWSLGIDPLRRLSPGVLQLRRLLSIAWSVQCAGRWFPDGALTYDAEVARAAAHF